MVTSPTTVSPKPTFESVTAPALDGHLWGAGVLIKATADDPTFTADLNTALTEVQTLPPAAEPGTDGKAKGR